MTVATAGCRFALRGHRGGGGVLACSAGACECPNASRATSTRLAVHGNAGNASPLTCCVVMVGTWHGRTANALDAVCSSILAHLSPVLSLSCVCLVVQTRYCSLFAPHLLFPSATPPVFLLFPPQKFEEIYLKECAKARPAPEAKFNYAWALIRSPARPDIRKGVIMMSGLLEDRFSDRDCLYYMAHGHYRLDDVVVRCSCACT